MWVFNYFLVIACFIGFVVALVESIMAILETPDRPLLFIRVVQGVVFACAGSVIAGLL